MPGRGELLVYEPFDYNSGMHGADGDSEIGFDAEAWDFGGSGMANNTANASQAGMQFGTQGRVLRSGANSGWFKVVNNGAASGSAEWFRGLNVSLGAGTNLWMSYLFRSETNITDTTGRAMNTRINGVGDEIEFLPKRNDVAAAHIRTSVAQDLSGARITDTETYLVIAKYGLNTNGTTGTVDAWALSEANFDEVARDGTVSEAELNGLAGIHAKGSSIGTLSADALLDDGDRFGVYFVPNVANATLNVSFDELRLATTLAEAAPVVSSLEKISDTFDDDSHLYNKSGTGIGWDSLSNSAGGSGVRTESGGKLTIETVGANDNSGIVSKFPLGISPTDRVRIVWDVDSAANWKTHGIEFMIQGGAGFRAADYMQFKLDPDDGVRTQVNIQGTRMANLGAYSGVADGFTITLTADATGWKYELSGLTAGGETSFTGSSYGPSSFEALFCNGGYVGATIQGQTPAATLVFNAITADVVPLGMVMSVR